MEGIAEQALDVAVDAILVVDTSGTVVLVNRSGAEPFGATDKSELVARSITSRTSRPRYSACAPGDAGTSSK